MRIRASTLEAHRFGRVRRKGYDPYEVDAVIARLVETMREYEVLTARLEAKVAEAEESSEAIRRTFLAAQRTRDEMIGEAEDLAKTTKASTEHKVAEMLAQAGEDAERLRFEASETLAAAHAESRRIATVADEVMTSAMQQAEAALAFSSERVEHDELMAERKLAGASASAQMVLEHAEREATRIRSVSAERAADIELESRTEAEALIAAAVAEAKALRARVLAETDELRERSGNEAEELRSSSAAEAEATLSRARRESEHHLTNARVEADERIAGARRRAAELIEEAERRAYDIVGESREEKELLDGRLGQLRSAVADVERELEKLARITLERVGFVSEVIDLEAEGTRIVLRTSEEPRERAAEPAGPVQPAAMLSTITAASGGAAVTSTSRTPQRDAEVDIAAMAAHRDQAFADPDGSGTPPAQRRMVSPEDAAPEHEGTSTIYQRRIKGLKDRIARHAGD
jgi:DivIVA domain-containing protein